MWLGLAAVALVVLAVAWWRGGATRTPPPLDAARDTVVFLGDSITSGHGLPLEVTFASRLGVALAVPVRNAGISGDQTAGGLARLERDVLDHRPKLVVVELHRLDRSPRHRAQRSPLVAFPPAAHLITRFTRAALHSRTSSPKRRTRRARMGREWFPKHTVGALVDERARRHGDREGSPLPGAALDLRRTRPRRRRRRARPPRPRHRAGRPGGPLDVEPAGVGPRPPSPSCGLGPSCFPSTRAFAPRTWPTSSVSPTRPPSLLAERSGPVDYLGMVARAAPVDGLDR